VNENSPFTTDGDGEKTIELDEPQVMVAKNVGWATPSIHATRPS